MSDYHRNWQGHTDPRLDPNIVDDGRSPYVLLVVLILVGLVGGALYIDGARQLANHEQTQGQAAPPAGQR